MLTRLIYSQINEVLQTYKLPYVRAFIINDPLPGANAWVLDKRLKHVADEKHKYEMNVGLCCAGLACRKERSIAIHNTMYLLHKVFSLSKTVTYYGFDSHGWFHYVVTVD